MPKGTIVDYKSLIKPVISEAALEKSLDLLIRLYLEENSVCQKELIDSMCQSNYFTYNQAKEILKTFKDDDKVFA